MDNEQIISKLGMLKASAYVILEEVAKLEKELQPVQPKKKAGLTDEQKAKLLAKRRKLQARA